MPFHGVACEPAPNRSVKHIQSPEASMRKRGVVHPN